MPLWCLRGGHAKMKSSVIHMSFELEIASEKVSFGTFPKLNLLLKRAVVVGWHGDVSKQLKSI